MLAGVSSESASVVSAFHLLWAMRRLRFALSEADRRVDHVNKAIVTWTSIRSLRSKHFGGNSSHLPPKVFIVWQFCLFEFSYVLGFSERSHSCYCLRRVWRQTLVRPAPHPCFPRIGSCTDDVN